MTSADLIRESQDPSTSAARLAELAQIDRGLWPAIAVHAAAYPTLLDWLGQQGDPTVNAVLAMRSGLSAAVPAPSVTPAAQPVEQTRPAQAPSSLGATGDDNNKNLWLLGGVIAVILVLIGGAAFGATKVFGGDDDDKDEASSSQTIDAREPAEAPTVGIPATESEKDSDSTGFLFCEKVQVARDALVGDPNAKPGSASVKNVAGIFGDLEDSAPAEIKGDVGVMADYFEALSDPSSLDTSTTSERVEAFTAAGKRLSTYYSSNCM